MTAISVTQMWSKEGGSGESDKYDSFASRFSHTEGYMVEAEIGDSAEDVLAAGIIPDYGARHRSGADSFVVSKEASALGPIFWVVTVNFKGEAFNPNVEVEWTDTTSTEPIDRDYDGNAILTAVYEQVEGLTYDLSDQVCVIRRNFFLIDPYVVSEYRHATNSDTFLGWPPGTARLVGFSAKNKFKYNTPIEMWDVTARIQFRRPYMGATPEQAWYKRWRHEGIYINVVNQISSEIEFGGRARDELGQEVSRPVLLKEDGTREFDPAAALFKYTKLYGSLPYSALGLT